MSNAPASHPALEALSPAVFAQIKGIQLRTQHLVNTHLAGEYQSAFKGRGMEFEKVREYQPGDDIRHIDWNVTARMRAPFVKEHKEERELTVMLVVDVSSSGAFGSHKQFKNEIAAEIAAVLEYMAIQNNDRVGLLVFSEGVEHFIPPKKGRAHVWRLIRDILTFTPHKQHTHLDEALQYLNRVVQKRCVTFVISDFIDIQDTASLRLTAQRHDVTAIEVLDPRDVSLPDVGLITFEDAETGEWVVCDTSDAGWMKHYHNTHKNQRQALQQMLQKYRIGHVSVQTHEPYIHPLVRFFKNKER